MKVRTITLEITRHGPPHNQLISPLTQYLAQSGRYEAVTLQLPWDHWRFLRELRVLRYGSGQGTAAETSRIGSGDIADIAAQVSQVFRAVPGLIAGLSNCGTSADTLTHIRLIFSPAELSLVPFEMSKAPGGFPGEGDFLSTQPIVPLLMTREIRGATGRAQAWPVEPKLLFAWAQPPGLSEVPWRAHLQALVGALRPWTGLTVPRPAAAVSATPAARLAQHLTVLPQATLADIAAACARQAYTHVHLLAHGGRLGDPEHPRYSVLLRGAVGSLDPDRVDGERLAAALTGQLASAKPSANCFSCPAVVTLANCDSGNQGGVVVPGSSLAHTLHAAGIPLVVGSLFPLSKPGSITLTQNLYSGLLNGDDPRWVLHGARCALRVHERNAHDWASVVVYASFPDTLDDDVTRAKYRASNSSIAIINSQIEESLLYDGDQLAVGGSAKPILQRLLDDLDVAATRLPTTGAYEIEGNGLVGAKDKRKAQALFTLARTAAGDLQKKHLRDSVAALTQAVRHYRAGSVNMQSSFRWSVGAPHWVLTQVLATEAALGMVLRPKEWRRAVASSQLDLDASPEKHAWAHASLVELYLLRPLLQNPPADLMLTEVAAKQALHSAREAAAGARIADYIVESTKRQIERYKDWWRTPLWKDCLASIGRPHDESAWSKVDELVEQILSILDDAN